MIEQLAEQARGSISAFCIGECKSYCCRKGFLALTGPEADLVTNKAKDELIANSILKRLASGNFTLYLGDYRYPCPSLKDFRCSIHKNPQRPQACKNFPIFVTGKSVQLSHRCLAVKLGMFYPYIKKWLALGCRVEESDPFFDLELIKK